MKIAFYVSRFKEDTVQTPPSLQYLGGYLLDKGLSEEKDILFADTIEQIVAFKPDILGVGSVSQCLHDAVQMACEARSAMPDCWNVLGGYHISALPQTLPQAFDIGVIGEGELTFAELVSLRMKSKKPDDELLRQIKGVCYRDGEDKIVQTHRRPLVKDIDTLPLPLRRIPYGQEWPYLFTARGCPYHCIYCASNTFWGHYRFHSAEYIVHEIDRMVESFGVKSIYLVDDLFIEPKKRLRELSRFIKDRGWLGKIRFKGFVRVNLVDEEVLGILKEMGFIEVRFGMETASEKLLNLIKDQPFTIRQAESVIDLCNKYEIPVCASFMFGIPGEDEDDINTSRDFLRKHRGRFSISGFYLMQPVPGTKLWEDCLAKGMLSTEIDFASLELDLSRENFDWARVLYLNADKIPLPKFKEVMSEICAEFVNPHKPEKMTSDKKSKPPVNVFLSIVQKGKSLMRAVLHQLGYEIHRISLVMRYTGYSQHLLKRLWKEKRDLVYMSVVAPIRGRAM
jgi:radical SAM superfamily enzyme YgiQ (UPF0313 family)